MIARAGLGICLLALASLAFEAPAAETKPSSRAQRQLALGAKAWTGDFDAMLERRMIRVAIPYSRSLYYVDKGRERGLNAERRESLVALIKSVAASR